MSVVVVVTEPIKIDIWSDIACPWCYIGKRKFEAGSGLFQGAGDDRAVEVEYHSFELNPETPVEFEGSEVEYLAKHKGIDPAQATQMLDRVTAIAEQAGLHYDFPSVKHTNTVLGHRLIHYAKAHGKQAEMKERLLSAHFVEGGHVGHVEDLADYAAEVGLDRDDVVRSLTSDEYLEAVRDDEALAQEYGISGVPFFVVDGKYGVSGAQEAATFAQVLEQVWTERSSEAAEQSEEVGA